MNNNFLLNSGLSSTAYSGFSMKPTLVASITLSISFMFWAYLPSDENHAEPNQEISLNKFSYKGIESHSLSFLITHNEKDFSSRELTVAQDEYFAKLIKAADHANNGISIPKNQTVDEFINFINAL